MVGTGAIDLYWRGNGGVWCSRSLLGDDAEENVTLYIPTGDGVVGYGAVYLYWRRCGRLPHCRILLGIE